jgi:hypothetical protein
MEAAWTNRLVEHFNRIEPILILSPAPSVPVLLRMLLCMVLIKGTDRRQYSNMRRAIEVFVDKYPALLDSLQHFEELRTGILSRVGGDLNQKNDSISAQGSAFPATIDCISALAASTFPPTASDKKPRSPRPTGSSSTPKGTRTDHCTYCPTTFSKYHYHKVADCRFKKQGITATSAHLATPSSIPPTPEQMRTYLASMGYVITPDDDEEA